MANEEGGCYCDKKGVYIFSILGVILTVGALAISSAIYLWKFIKTHHSLITSIETLVEELGKTIKDMVGVVSSTVADITALKTLVGTLISDI